MKFVIAEKRRKGQGNAEIGLAGAAGVSDRY
jgi:hypothetical protein